MYKNSFLTGVYKIKKYLVKLMGDKTYRHELLINRGIFTSTLLFLDVSRRFVTFRANEKISVKFYKNKTK